MKLIVAAIELLPDVIQNTALMIRFKAWQKGERGKGTLPSEQGNAKEIVAKLLLFGLLAMTTMAASCPGDIRDFAEYCRTHPEEHGLCDRFRPARPTPRPSPPTCCVSQGGVHQIEAPGRICRTDLPTGDSNCWHDPADGCDSCWVFIPPVVVATATPTPAPSATPTRTPVISQTPTPTVEPTPPCVDCKNESPVTIAYVGRCPKGFAELAWEDRIAKPVGFNKLCGGDWGEGNHRPWWRLGDGLANKGFDLFKMGDAWVQREINAHEVTCHDGLGRTYVNCERLYDTTSPPDFKFNPWTHGSYAKPLCCEDIPRPTATPTTAPTAEPPSSAPRGTVRNFKWAWTNPSDHCRDFKDLGNGQGQCTSDAAHRWNAFVALEKPNGTLEEEEFVQNTCDKDHWICAIQPCDPEGRGPEEWAKILRAHRQTYVMCGGNGDKISDEWIVSEGVRHEWKPAGEGDNRISVADKEPKNPYQGSFVANIGSFVEARGCMPDNAHSCPDAFRGKDGFNEFNCAPQHRRPVPGSGCSAWKPAYEIKK